MSNCFIITYAEDNVFSYTKWKRGLGNVSSSKIIFPILAYISYVKNFRKVGKQVLLNMESTLKATFYKLHFTLNLPG